MYPCPPKVRNMNLMSFTSHRHFDRHIHIYQFNRIVLVSGLCLSKTKKISSMKSLSSWPTVSLIQLSSQEQLTTVS